MKKLIGICCAVLFVASCKKEMNVEPDDATTTNIIDTVVHHDTVKIGNYFPAYPKSIWHYKDQSGKEFTYRTDSAYTLLTETTLKLIYHNPVYVTKYEGRSVDGYRLINVAGGYQPWVELLPANILKGMFVREATRPYQIMSSVDVIDTTVMVNGVNYDNVIITSTYAITGVVGGSPIYGVSEKSYFAKDIGIIKNIYFDIPTGNEVGEEVLMSYTIGKK